MSDVHGDLGYLSPEEVKDIPLKGRSVLKPRFSDLFESDEVTEQRRQLSFSWIRSVASKDLRDPGSSKVTMDIKGKRFDFFPASNTYYVHSTGVYGYGIDKLCQQIKTRLLGQA